MTPDGQHCVTGDSTAFSVHDRTTRFTEPISAQLRGVLLAEDKQIIAVSFDGYYRAADPEPELVYVVQTNRSQDTYTPSQFSSKFKWRNAAVRVKLIGK